MKVEVKPIAKKENIVNLSVSYPTDKYEALDFHARKLGEKVEDYLTESLEKWYKRKVPAGVRAYLDEKYEMEFGTPPEPLNIPAPEPEGSPDIPSWES